MQLITALKQYGLLENEAKVYLSLLKLIEAPAYQIAYKAQLPRTSVYHILADLKNKGLIFEFKKRNICYFTPESPYVLIESLQKRKKIIQEILPKLELLSVEQDIKPDVSLFLGKEGVKKVYNDILKTLKQTKEKQLLVISQPIIFKLLPRFFPDWVERRKKLAVFSQIIFPDSPEAHEFNNLYQNNLLGEIRFMPKKYNWLGTFNIYSNKVALFSLVKKELNAIIIENKTLAEMFRNFFQFNWEVLAKKA